MKQRYDSVVCAMVSELSMSHRHMFRVHILIHLPLGYASVIL